MTKKELMDKLAGYPDDAEILTYQDDELVPVDLHPELKYGVTSLEYSQRHGELVRRHVAMAIII